jgi:hypothetical protein
VRAFLQQRNDRFYERWIDCFGTSRALLPLGDRAGDLDQIGLEPSVSLGLIAVDPAAARRCLETLMTASCERIADIAAHDSFDARNPVLPECAGALAGQVAPGKTCRRNEECQSPDQYACVGEWGCGRVCTARVQRAAGEACSDLSDRCAPGTVCRYGARNSNFELCLAPTPEGADCDETYECAAGLHCAERTATSVFDGTCRPMKLGSPCAGNWDCVYSFVCEGAGPKRRGTCQVGKPLGAACTTYLADVNDNVYSDCAVLTQCFDLDGMGPRCVDGSPLGGTCGQMATGPHGGWLDCLEGYCDALGQAQPSVGTCRPAKPLDSACRLDQECVPPGRCLKIGGVQRCALHEVAAAPGRPCSLFGDDDCGMDGYCAPLPVFDPNDPHAPTMGQCTPLKRAGEACRHGADRCEPLADCVQGVCKKC